MANSMPNTMPKTKANTKPKTKANNEPYRKVKITMWNDPKFCELSALPPSGQSLFVYLLTSPFTGIIPGLFKAGRAAMAEELGWEMEDFDLALGEALSLGMVKADLKARVFWLPNAARHNPPASGNVVKSWVRAFELLPECDLKWEARESLKAACYGVSETMGKAFDMAIPLPKDKPKAMPSGIQLAVNSKQILKDKTLLSRGEKDATGPDDDSEPSDDEQGPQKPNGLTKHEYPAEFEAAWLEYPKRPGSQDKHGAHKAWSARLRDGVPADAMLDGVRRYAVFVNATGKSGTEFIKQAKTFFGPSKHFEDDWQVITGGSNAAKNTSSAGSTAWQQVRDARNAQRAEQGLDPVGNDGANIFGSLGEEEWPDAFDGLDSSDFEVLG